MGNSRQMLIRGLFTSCCTGGGLKCLIVISEGHISPPYWPVRWIAPTAIHIRNVNQ